MNNKVSGFRAEVGSVDDTPENRKENNHQDNMSEK